MSTSRTNTKKKKRRQTRRLQDEHLVMKLLLLVTAVLIISEGKLVYTMLTHRSGSSITVTDGSGAGVQTDAAESLMDADDLDLPVGDDSFSTTAQAVSTSRGTFMDAPLAGLNAIAPRKNTTQVRDTSSEASSGDGRISEVIDSPAVVARQEEPVDDSYFSDAVFIGDSRMEGFRNASGITQGTFLTSIGLSTEGMSNQNIATPDGTISVYQGLSGIRYKKIYLMLGTNDLGFYPMENFPGEFTNVIQQFHKLQPDAAIYVCSVILLNEAKVSISYNTNANVRTINKYLLEVCEELDYCHYLNLNEIFNDGYGSLPAEASPDGIHLYGPYCEDMLNYLKNHYV